MDKTVADSFAAVQKASSSLMAKMKQGGNAEDGSRLKECRDEMIKLKEPVTKAQKSMEELKAKIAKGRGEFANKERAEQNAHIEAKNMKEAAAFIEGPKAKVEELEADAKAVEEAGAAMASLTGDELQAFATPASLVEKVEKLLAKVSEHATAARELIKEQVKAATEVSPQTGGTGEAKKQLKNLSLKTDEAARKSSKVLSILKSKCNLVVTAKLDSVSEGIRQHAQKKKLSPEELFESLKSGEKMPEKAFCKMVGSLPDLAVQPEHATLLCRKLEADGLSRETFMKYVVLYFKVVKGIAFTDALAIGSCKTIRKADEGEVLEALEGPLLDEASQMTRVRARSTVDGKVTEGWITVAGSKGTAFLEKTTRPKPAVAAKA